MANETDCVSGGALTLWPWKTVALAALIITHLYAVSSRQRSIMIGEDVNNKMRWIFAIRTERLILLYVVEKEEKHCVSN